ncbi:cholinesterase-like [Pseudophryne corroboree]|uniref:cholinesterase-like n=1 Tax=Pseudophryne corroboree TaxID=495146 RepID=UPI003081D59D
MTPERKITWLILILSFVAICTNAEDDTIIETKQGKVSGFTLSVLSDTVTAYTGIPYAEAPIGFKRFQKPEPRKPWLGIHKATKFGNSCYQSKSEAYSELPGVDKWLVKNEMSEDCLNLNVWVPQSISKPAHVMVFIYGGGFISGTSSLAVYDGSVLAATEKVIVVSMNYRVGALGFLAFPGSKDVPGNSGLFDQRLALQWVHDNIAAFGGDPGSVTLFGQSAGAASVGYHVLSTGSHSYFKRVIIQSGSPTADWAFNSKERARILSLKLAQRIGCPTEDDNSTIACLKNVDAKEIIHKQLPTDSKFELTYFVPTIDNDFLLDVPKNLVNQTNKHIDILIGVTKDDGNPFPVFAGQGISTKYLSLITTEQLEQGLRQFFPPGEELAIESFKLLYIDWDDEGNQEKNRDALAKILKDYYFTCPSKYFASFAAETTNNVFVYEYDHRPSNEVWPQWMGAIHGAELPIIFGNPFSAPQEFSQEEQAFSKRIMKMWANFAREGNPSDDGFVWPHYSTGDQNHAILKMNNISVRQKWSGQNCQFWNFYYPEQVKKHRKILT